MKAQYCDLPEESKKSMSIRELVFSAACSNALPKKLKKITG